MKIIIMLISFILIQDLAGQLQSSGRLFHLGAVALIETMDNLILGVLSQAGLCINGDGNHVSALLNSQLGRRYCLRGIAA